MSPSYLEHFPQPVLDDLVAGRWLPILGAGMSRNAVVPNGATIPLWEDLGKTLAKELPNYAYAGPIDAISAYAHEFGRPRLVERVSMALHVEDARPGDAHASFCNVPFDIVCTTNLDFLLERQWDATGRYCRPIVDEDHLTVNARGTGTALLKLHGDVHHPSRLILTEEDYDSFLGRYPLLATYLASLLISRTAVLVGYSLDDPDFRQIWQLIGDRLGAGRRVAYAIAVDAATTDIARFDRRGVKVISLPGSRRRYGEILAAAFDELRIYQANKIVHVSQVTEEQPLQELSLPPDSQTRLCFFAVPLSLQPFYRGRVFPLAIKHGLVPITAADVIAPGDGIVAKIDALIRKAALIVVDAGSPNTIAELRLAVFRKDVGNVLAIFEAGSIVGGKIYGAQVIYRSAIPLLDEDSFLTAVNRWLGERASELGPLLSEEPTRLLQKGEYRAAIVSAITLLEAVLAEHVDLDAADQRRRPSLSTLLSRAADVLPISEEQQREIREWMSVRSAIVHSGREVTRGEAKTIVESVLELVAFWRKWPFE